MKKIRKPQKTQSILFLALRWSSQLLYGTRSSTHQLFCWPRSRAFPFPHWKPHCRLPAEIWCRAPLPREAKFTQCEPRRPASSTRRDPACSDSSFRQEVANQLSKIWDQEFTPRRADHLLRIVPHVWPCQPTQNRSDCSIKNMFNCPTVTSCVSSDFRASSSSTKMECRLSTVCLHRVHRPRPSSARALPVALHHRLQEDLPPHAASTEKPTATVFIVHLLPAAAMSTLKFFNRTPATCTASSTAVRPHCRVCPRSQSRQQSESAQTKRQSTEPSPKCGNFWSATPNQ